MNFLQRLFAHPDPSPAVPRSILSSGLHVGCLTDPGKVRPQNEDVLCTLHSLIQDDHGAERFGLFIVADGMGGHDRGEVASALAVRTVVAHLLENIYLPDLNRTHQGAALNELLTAALHKANFMVNEQVPEGGTTLTMALVLANSAYIAHVGDSRAYFFHQDGMKQITTDHSMAQRFKALGQEVPPEATNVLYQAIGHGSTVEVEVHVQHLPPGASLLLCSDGLWGAVDDDHIFQEVILQASTPQQACEALIALANENGGHDNITAIVILRGFEN